MLFTITSLIDFLGAAISLWLAIYLLGCGFPSRAVLRGIAVLITLSALFLVTYIDLYDHFTNIKAFKAILLMVGLSVWNDLTDRLLTIQNQKGNFRQVGFVYASSLMIIILLLWAPATFGVGQNNVLWTTPRKGIQPTEIAYVIFLFLACFFILYNFRVSVKNSAGIQNRQFFVAVLFVVCAVIYEGIALLLVSPLPRFISDLLLLVASSLLGISFVRYLALVERRTTMPDFAISALTVFGLSDIYLFIAWRIGLSPIDLILVTGLAIITHSTYNLVREFLNRLRTKDESIFRKQIRRLEINVGRDVSFEQYLQDALTLLCRTLEATGAFIAVRDDKQYIVCTSYHSIPAGDPLILSENAWNEICEPPPELADQVAWLAPAFQAGDLVAILGVSPLKSGFQYTEDDLDLLVETADRIGIMIYLHSHRPVKQDRLTEPASDFQTYETSLRVRSEELFTTLAKNPDPQFVKMVEDGLRNLSDYISLGQSSLPEQLSIIGETHIEKGKAVQQQLIQAIEMLRPAKDLPKDPLPREWHSYIVLHEAYRTGIPNQEIMSKLYISEGTFHRTRRAAIRSVARALLEKSSSNSLSPQPES